jgi:hypothetical protein
MPRQGPIEAFIARVHELEVRLGMKPESSRGSSRRLGGLGPGGRWLAERLNNPRHPERLSRGEEDMLGHALVARDRGALREAQEYLDMLWQHHQLRLRLQQSTSDGIITSSTAYVSDNDDPKA